MQPTDLRTVLAATDLGESGDEVLRTAGALAVAAGAELHVLHAFDFLPDPYPTVIPTPPASFEAMIRKAENALDEQVRSTVPPEARVAGRKVVIDVAPRAILDYADGIGADVIVLGPHRKRGVGDFLGSTADRVVRSAKAPCLVARGRLQLPLRRVVVPFDLSDPARGALRTAVQWCDLLGEGPGAGEPGNGRPVVDVVHVIPRILAGLDVPLSEAVVAEELDREVGAAVGPAEERLGVEVRKLVLWGDSVPDEILAFARDRDADLLVMGTHGRGFLGRALLGSVASSATRRAEGPVLLVPPTLALEGDSGAGSRPGGSEPAAERRDRPRRSATRVPAPRRTREGNLLPLRHPRREIPRQSFHQPPTRLSTPARQSPPRRPGSFGSTLPGKRTYRWVPPAAGPSHTKPR